MTELIETAGGPIRNRPLRRRLMMALLSAVWFSPAAPPWGPMGSATPVRRIAEEADVAQGLLYNYFDGKEALLHAIFQRGMRDVEADLAAASSADGPEEALERLIRGAFETLRGNIDFWRLSYQLRMQPDVLAGLGEQFGTWARTIVVRIEALMGEADMSRAGARARVVFAAIDGAAQHYVLDPERYPSDQTVDEIVRTFSPLAARASTAPSTPGSPR